jgi:hypothetical protein
LSIEQTASLFNSMEAQMGNSVSTTVAGQRQRQWRNHLARQAKSGQSVAAFCRAESLSVGNFYAWRARLAAIGSNPGFGPLLTNPAAFIDLGVVSSDDRSSGAPRADRKPNASAASVEVRIDLGGGIVLTIQRH